MGGRVAGLVMALVGTGCHGLPSRDCCRPPHFDPCCVPGVPAPRELNKLALPAYVVEIPDVLHIRAGRLVPLTQYRVEAFDSLYVVAKPGTVFDEDPINGVYPVDADGTIDLGPKYRGRVAVAERTVAEAQAAVQAHVRGVAKTAEVTVSLAQSRGLQGIDGPHPVRSDGTIGLGTFGDVYVNGMTRAQARQAIEAHLGRFVARPEVAVDVCASPSKGYYVITDAGAAGEHVVRLPHTGNETVLDAVAAVGGPTGMADRTVWVARPAPPEAGGDTILPVDWCGVTRRGRTGTNYQLLPGDRVYVVSRPAGSVRRFLGGLR